MTSQLFFSPCVQADAKKLKFDHGLVCEGVVELGELAAQAFQDKVLQTASLVTLTKKVLGATFMKDRRATMSNWAIHDLAFEQIQYAAADAWLSYHLLMALYRLSLRPMPHESHRKFHNFLKHGTSLLFWLLFFVFLRILWNSKDYCSA